MHSQNFGRCHHRLILHPSTRSERRENSLPGPSPIRLRFVVAGGDRPIWDILSFVRIVHIPASLMRQPPFGWAKVSVLKFPHPHQILDADDRHLGCENMSLGRPAPAHQFGKRSPPET
jgi:hypothetical protein